MRRFGRAVLVVAVVLTVGAIGGAVGNYLGWRQASASPSAVEAQRWASIAVPGTALSFAWHDDVHDEHGHTDPGPENLPGQQEAMVPVELTPEAFAAARSRLKAAGWSVTSIIRADPPATTEFRASRGDVVQEWSRNGSLNGETTVWMWKYTPASVAGATAAGWGIGSVLGAVLAAVTKGIWPRRVLISVIGVGSLSTVLASALAITSLLLRTPQDSQPIALWIAYWPFLAPFGFTLG